MNMQKMLKQAQKMQEKIQRDLEETSVEASVGGDILRVKVNGHKHLLSVTIDREALNLDPDDVGMLEDLILAAVNEAHRKVDETIKKQVGSLAPSIPGLF